jgi:3-(3-hydroxy-phenyl)propionate hydroxylase
MVVTQHGGSVAGLPVLADPKGLVEHRFDGKAGTAVLIRPDQHVAARWRRFDPVAVRSAVARATCQPLAA